MNFNSAIKKQNKTYNQCPIPSMLSTCILHWQSNRNDFNVIESIPSHPIPLQRNVMAYVGCQSDVQLLVALDRTKTNVILITWQTPLCVTFPDLFFLEMDIDILVSRPLASYVTNVTAETNLRPSPSYPNSKITVVNKSTYYLLRYSIPLRRSSFIGCGLFLLSLKLK